MAQISKKTRNNRRFDMFEEVIIVILFPGYDISELAA